MKITVLNTGGTFNKRYNPLTGNLDVPSDNLALNKIIKSCPNISFDIKNIVSKDSLDFTQEDRDFIPIIQFGEDIAWVVPMKVSDKYKITDGTKNMLEIVVRRR